MVLSAQSALNPHCEKGLLSKGAKQCLLLHSEEQSECINKSEKEDDDGGELKSDYKKS